MSTMAGLENDPDFLTRFSRHLAHELNNPISAISSSVFLIEDFMESAKEGLLSVEEIRPFIEGIHDECESMKGIVEEFSKFFSLKSILASPLDLSEFVAHRADEMIREGLPVTLEKKQEKCIVSGDAGALQVVVRTLVDDAVAAGAAAVTLSCEPDGIIISDDRTGVAENSQAYFDSWKARFSSFGKKPGLGLRLPLAAKIVELHHGSIELTAEQATGAEVRVLIPKSSAA